MEDRSNKTIMCSVLFLDIVEYSKKSVTGQISLKDRFNTYLSEAIHDVPVSDRIILDTGDGAAVNFLGDVESALTAALRLRESLLSEPLDIEPQLLVRIGINLGPVRLVRDINGQPNIVGDGINVAQRVMAFAEPSQILVSRSYYDAVSRLSAQYTGMFHSQGSRTDKHVREHEIYAIGYPGDQTSKHENAVLQPAMSDQAGVSENWFVAALGGWSARVRNANGKQRVLYVGMLAVPLLMLAAVLVFVRGHQSADISLPLPDVAQPVVETMPASAPAPAASAVAAPQAAPIKPSTAKAASEKSAKVIENHKTEPAPHKKKAEGTVQNKSADPVTQKSSSGSVAAESVDEASVSVSCKEGTQVFLDGVQKGRIAAVPLKLTGKPGTHKLIITHASFGLYSQNIVLEAGKTRAIKPDVCN